MLPEVLARLFQQRTQSRLIRFDEQILKYKLIDDTELQLTIFAAFTPRTGT